MKKAALITLTVTFWIGIAPVAPAQPGILATTFLSNAGQAGNMFDLVAARDVTITAFDVHIQPGAWDLEIWTTPGSARGKEATPSSWTLVGQAPGVLSAGPNLPTPCPIPVGVCIPAGATRGFYVTVTNGLGMNYTTTTMPGSVVASDANLSVLAGTGNPYPFQSPFFSPRIWNGRVLYVAGTVCPPPPWQGNTPMSALDLDGVATNGTSPAITPTCPGRPVTLTARTLAPGSGFDIGITGAALRPGLLVTAGGQVVNLDSGHPTLTWLNSGSAVPSLLGHPGTVATAFSLPVPLTASAQQLVLDPGHQDGFSLSQGVELQVSPPTGLPLPLQDDATIRIDLGAPPLCYGGTVTFYGTSYTELFVNSNGDVSFTQGHGSFLPTLLQWTTGFPRIGVHGDYQPDQFGTIALHVQGQALHIVYTGMTEWGSGGLGVTSYTVAFNDPAAPVAILNFTTDGTWSQIPVIAGASNGALGTHPAPIVFAAAAGLGPLGSANGTDSVIENATLGMIATTTPWSHILLPNGDGSTYVVQ
jgi:hypothetical protein